MARIFDRINEWETYVPDIGNERALFASDPGNAFTVEIRYLNARAAKQYDRIWQRAAVDDALIKADEADLRMFAENVRNVRNYAPNGEMISTGGQLWEQGERVVIADIQAAIQLRSRLDAGLEKKLNSRSSTPTALATARGNGPVVGATDLSAQPAPAIQTRMIPRPGLTTPKNDGSVIATATRTPA